LALTMEVVMTNAKVDQFSRMGELLPELTKKERKVVAQLFTHVVVRPGRVLTQEGDIGREVMFIESGTARVEREGNTVARLGPGDFFGELALLTGARRTAKVTAESDMVVAALTRQEFASLLDTSPKLAQKILVNAVRRLHVNAA
jgi:CRP-like cAMP-binding protein